MPFRSYISALILAYPFMFLYFPVKLANILELASKLSSVTVKKHSKIFKSQIFLNQCEIHWFSAITFTLNRRMSRFVKRYVLTCKADVASLSNVFAHNPKQSFKRVYSDHLFRV